MSEIEYDKSDFNIIGDRLIKYYGNSSVINVPDGVHSIAAQAFSECQKIQEINIPKTVSLIGSLAFSNCNKLQKINIENDYVTIGEDAFLNTAFVQNYPNDSIIYIGLIAYKYKGKCPKSIALRDGTLGISSFAFAYCKELEEIGIPGTVKVIPSGAFYNCKNLSRVMLSEGVEKINDMSFWGCENLSNLLLPISLISIGESFKNHPNKFKLCIQENVSEIHPMAFNYCDVEMHCIPNTYAYSYAVKNHFELIPYLPKRVKESTVQSE